MNLLQWQKGLRVAAVANCLSAVSLIVAISEINEVLTGAVLVTALIVNCVKIKNKDETK